MNRYYYLVLDVETANMVNQPLTYDIGFAVVDRNGNIYERSSYVVSEIFFDEKTINCNAELMNTAYYAEKLPLYYEGIKSGKWSVAPLYVIRHRIYELIDKYQIKAVCAYNAYFDTNALNNTIRYVTKSKYRYFFPYDLPVYDIWHMATQTILNRPTYFRYALDNRETFENAQTGNVSTKAEQAYAYLTKRADFNEQHTGLADVEIEAYIMAMCFKTHKKMDKTVNRLCWRIPQKPYREYKSKVEEKLSR